MPKNKLFATNHDMGSAQAMAPALHVLQQQGSEVVAFVNGATLRPQDHPDVSQEELPEAPASQIFRAAGLDTRTIQGDSDLRSMIASEKPDLVLVGISAPDYGSEKMALKAAIELGIPVAFIVETWPHRWLEVYEQRDIPLYRQAGLGLLWDQFSCDHMKSQGFDSTLFVATGNPSQDAFAALKNDRAKHRAAMRDRFRIPEDAVLIQYSTALSLDDPEEDKPGHREWSGFSEADSVREYLTAMRDVASENAPYKVRGVIRQKPSFSGVRVQEMIREICPAVIYDNSRETGNALLLASDIVVGSMTLMIQNAAMLGVPGAFYLPDLCTPDPMISNRLGFTIPMYARGDLGQLIRDAAYRPDHLKEFTRKVRPIDLPLDATGNVVTAIRNFLDR
ncbi:hypothetical protein HY479_00460 [Candidatus Uhrbacteria bacterium]|nr:hypothetical protein [Candidatus Uhrbacteria bacterium]